MPKKVAAVFLVVLPALLLVLRLDPYQVGITLQMFPLRLDPYQVGITLQMFPLSLSLVRGIYRRMVYRILVLVAVYSFSSLASEGVDIRSIYA